jgi:hypothetical protein
MTFLSKYILSKEAVVEYTFHVMVINNDVTGKASIVSPRKAQ